MISSSSICVVGSANVDFTMRVAHLPAPGETITGGEFHRHFGGKGANQAVAAARAGGEVAFVGAVGTDALSREMLEALGRDGLELSHVARLEAHPPGTALIMLDHAGENCITVASGANGALDSARVDAAETRIAGSDWILLQMETPLESNVRVLELAAKHGVSVLLNYAPATRMDMPLDERVTGLVVNETEAAALLDRPVDGEDPEACAAAARDLLSAGHRFVLLTMGRHGVIQATGEGTVRHAAFSVKAVDTTAAGDTFCGALAVSLGEGRSLEQACRFASAAAALAVTRPGAQPSIPRRAEIEAFFEQEDVAESAEEN
ncbi:MAG: ribokinase [Verrucomicrobia bacterium]|nr:ribokinase [Verrucomicrobiota bacterium]MCH8511342.1 ribokinase [Kiritimatiellia bacterium]